MLDGVMMVNFRGGGLKKKKKLKMVVEEKGGRRFPEARQRGGAPRGMVVAGDSMGERKRER